MRIQFKPLYHMEEIIHFHSRALEQQYEGISRWKYGEVKNIPEDLRFREKIDGMEPHYVNLIEDLLADDNFKVYEKGVNPNSVCKQCNVITSQDVIVKGHWGVRLEDEDGNRLCPDCYNKQSS